MQKARRQELLRIMGVDLYDRRSLVPAQPDVLPEQEEIAPKSEEVAAKPATSPVSKIVADKPPATPKNQPKKAAGVPMALAWWQFDDLLLLEDLQAGPASESMQSLALAIGTALNRSAGLNGELQWPPGGDFSAISPADFLRHFVQGRSEGADQQLLLVLTSDRLIEHAAELGEVHRIPALSAMLGEPALKAEAWKILKPLRSP
jgi:hypothetical protein